MRLDRSFGRAVPSQRCDFGSKGLNRESGRLPFRTNSTTGPRLPGGVDGRMPTRHRGNAMSTDALSGEFHLDDLLNADPNALTANTERFLAATLPSNPHRHGHRQEFSQSNLVSDNQLGHLSRADARPQPDQPVGHFVPPTSPFWIANNHTGTATLYSVDPHDERDDDRSHLVVTIAPPQAVRRAGQPDRHRVQHRPAGLSC